MSHYLTAVLRNLRGRFDDDTVDKFNYYYTSAIILVFAVLVSAKQYVGYPIQCWVPAHFTEAMEQYTENYCWVQNTWFLPLAEQVPKVKQRQANEIIYYQWVPFILILQALLFTIPCFTWRILYWHTGLDIQNIIAMGNEARGMMEEMTRAKTLNAVAKYIDDSLEDKPLLKFSPKSPSNFSFPNLSPFDQGPDHLVECQATKADMPVTLTERVTDFVLTLIGSRQRKSGCGLYVTWIYLMIKVLYCFNIIFQFALLYYLLGTKTPLFGFDLMRELAAGRDWFSTGLFPRVTLCDFEVKVMGNLHRHTVQCVLMINMFNEKIFLFMWFWFAFLFFLTVLNTVVWMITLLAPEKRIFFVRKHLKFHHYEHRFNDDEKQLLDKFACKYLRHDGVFLLNLMGLHAGHVVLNEVIALLWTEYRHRNLRYILPPEYHFKDFAGSPFSSMFSGDKSMNFEGLLMDPNSAERSPLLYDRADIDGGSDVSSFKESMPVMDKRHSRFSRGDSRSEKEDNINRVQQKVRAQQREQRVMTGDRDLRKHGIVPGKNPAKELKLASKSMFKSGKYEHHNADRFL